MSAVLPRRGSGPVLAAALVSLLPLSARAQGWTLRPALQTTLSATDNGNHAAAEAARADLRASLQPNLELAGQGPGFRLRASLGAELVAHADAQLPRRAYPQVLADAAATLVPRWLFVDTSASVQALERDPYGPRSESGSTENRSVTTAWRISPYLEHALSPTASVLARYEEVGSRTGAQAAAAQRFSNLELRAVRRPLRWGGSLSLRSHSVRFGGGADSRSALQSLTARGDLALAGGDLVLGPLAGAERSRLLLDAHTDTLYGAHATWTPSERTRVAAEAVHRFFGTGWTLETQHRMPWSSFTLQFSRTPLTMPTSLGVSAAGAGLDSFLDAMLTTRYPDAAQRKALVSSLVAARGLPPGLPGPVDVQAEYAQLQDSRRATWVLMGTRNIVTLSAYALTLRQLTREGSVAAVLPLNLDSRQSGASLDLNRRLSPLLTMDAAASWSRIGSLGAGPEDRSREFTLRLSALRRLAPSTALSMGLQRQRFDTTRAGAASYRALSAFVGLKHSF